jgi:hypothetical protein
MQVKLPDLNAPPFTCASSGGVAFNFYLAPRTFHEAEKVCNKACGHLASYR